MAPASAAAAAAAALALLAPAAGAPAPPAALLHATTKSVYGQARLVGAGTAVAASTYLYPPALVQLYDLPGGALAWEDDLGVGRTMPFLAASRAGNASAGAAGAVAALVVTKTAGVLGSCTLLGWAAGARAPTPAWATPLAATDCDLPNLADTLEYLAVAPGGGRIATMTQRAVGGGNPLTLSLLDAASGAPLWQVTHSSGNVQFDGFGPAFSGDGASIVLGTGIQQSPPYNASVYDAGTGALVGWADNDENVQPRLSADGGILATGNGPAVELSTPPAGGAGARRFTPLAVVPPPDASGLQPGAAWQPGSMAWCPGPLPAPHAGEDLLAVGYTATDFSSTALQMFFVARANASAPLALAAAHISAANAQLVASITAVRCDGVFGLATSYGGDKPGEAPTVVVLDGGAGPAAPPAFAFATPGSMLDGDVRVVADANGTRHLLVAAAGATTLGGGQDAGGELFVWRV
jgi:hypothetical protein